jgi:hypothetical protein
MPAETNRTKSAQGERRESFRINDTLPLIIRKIEEDTPFPEPERRVDDPQALSPAVLEKENISPILWKMLVRLDRKLDRVLEKIPVDLLNTKAQPVNLSSTGMKIKVKKRLSPDESVRIKMLLPTLPVRELDVIGQVVRIESLPGGDFEVALHFLEMDDNVRDEIILYTINQQRKTIAAQRQKRGHDESDKG